MPLVSGCLTAVLVVAVVALAYGSAAPALSVAEFSPSANQKVEAPSTTTVDDQGGAGGSAGRRARATTTTAPTVETTDPENPTASAPTTRVGRARTCVGSPPRQTEDPMSPPCMPTIFEGDNGGATAAGVSGTEVRVAIPVATNGGYVAGGKAAINALFDDFNRKFEFYGRRLVPVYPDGAAWDGASARAFGATVAAQGVFGALTGFLEAWGADISKGVQPGLLQELARNSIVTVTNNSGVGWSDRVIFDALHPFVWSVYPSAESNQDNLASLACTGLVDHPASHASDAALRQTTRRFGILAVGVEAAASTSRLVQALTACDEAPAVATVNGTNANDLRAAFERLKGGGTTSVVCLCEGLYGYITVRSTALNAGFGPEWLVLPSALNFEEFLVNGNADRTSLIRLESGPRLLPIQNRPWFGPLLTSGYLYDTSDTTRRDGFYVSQAIYGGLMVLASGIQAAGPHLTPETFAAGLMSTSFPNPGAGQAPYWQPSSGFGPGDHAFYDDYAVAWWSDTAPSVDQWSAKGSWCYLGAGARFHSGTYPVDADARLYNPNEPCR